MKNIFSGLTNWLSLRAPTVTCSNALNARYRLSQIATLVLASGLMVSIAIAGSRIEGDADGDGVPDAADQCPGTPPSVLVDVDGCSSKQRLDIACPLKADYKNHGHYMSCVVREIQIQYQIGLIDAGSRGELVSDAARSRVGSKPPGPPDRLAPIILDGPTVLATASSASIQYTTNEEANITVLYGTTPGGPDYPNVAFNPEFSLTPSVDLTSLEPETIYYFVGVLCDHSGNCTVTDEGSFVTAARPTLEILSPEPGATLNTGDILIDFAVKGWTVGGKGMSHVLFQVDNVPGLHELDQLMFYNGDDQIVELNRTPGLTLFASWVDEDTIRINNVPDGLHWISAHLATSDHESPGNPEAEVTFSIVVDTGSIDPPEGLVAWWSFDDRSEIRAADLVGENYGSHLGDPRPVDGRVDAALRFDGIDDFVQVPDHASLNFSGSDPAVPNSGDFAVDFWVNTTAGVGRQVILSKYADLPSPRGYAIVVEDGVVKLEIGDGTAASYDSHVFVADGNWHLVAVSVDRDRPNGGTFFIDGDEAGQFDPGDQNNSLENDEPLTIGAAITPDGLGDFFQGVVDELEVFDRTLSPVQMQLIFAAGTAGKYQSPLIL